MPRSEPEERWPKRLVSLSYQTGPLSLEKIRRVFLLMPAFSRLPITWPMTWSTCIMKSPYMPAALLPMNSFVGSQGVCGEGRAR